jgi:hypothetical protein
MMTRFQLVLLVCISLLGAAITVHAKPRPTTPLAERLDPARMQVVVAGVLQWKDPAIPDFDTSDRKDRGFYETLGSWGVPDDQRVLLVDAQATTAAITKALKKAIARARPTDTLMFYFGGHGVIQNRGNRIVLVTAGTRLRALGRGLYADQLAKLFVGKFKGRRVMLMGDFCYSGAFAEVAKTLKKAGIDAISLTSAAASNVSTANWTYSQTLIDAFSGSPTCDHDGDGVIALEEVGAEVTERLKFRERQRAGWEPSQNAVLVVADTDQTLPTPLPASWVELRYKGRGWPARVIKRGPDDALVLSLYDYNRWVELKRKMGQTRPLKFRRYKAGARVKVMLQGKTQVATIKRVEGYFHYVDYKTLGPKWSEWVASHRIVETVGGESAQGVTRVEVRWVGKWYRAEVLERRDDGTTCIHYIGYGQEWDECVLPERIREIST